MAVRFCRFQGHAMSSATSSATPRERFLGCLLGLAVGDSLCAPYEGLTGDDIYFRFGTTDQLVRNPDGDVLRYTDDTQMMIGVAETLIACGKIDEEHLCERFAANYDETRGYGRGARLILEAIPHGAERRRQTAAMVFPGGSLGNGAAMRVAPVGLCFAHDHARLWKQASDSAIPTHVHPLGIEGAQILALAVGLAYQATRFDRKAFWSELSSRAVTEEFQWALRTASHLRRSDTISVLGSTLHAHKSVVTAIACFARHPNDFEAAIATTLALGDDTDTLAAMAGALCGAFGGIQAIPSDRIAELEEDGKGRSYITHLAETLYERASATFTP